MEQTQEAPVEVNAQDGTSDIPGQSEVVNQPNDPGHMQSKIEMTQAEFTRQMQELSESRKKVEQEQAALSQQLQQIQMQRQNLNVQPQQQYPQDQGNVFIEQFGPEAGQALLAEFNQIKVNNELMKEENEIRRKIGADYDKYNYQVQNPYTGQMETRNKIMDKRTMMNPLTGQWMTIDEAIHAARSPEEIEAQIRQKVMEELKAKQDAGAITQTAAPTTAAQGDGSLDDAFRQAYAKHGGF